MLQEKKIFKNFFELGTYIQKKRRETGERVEAISSKLLIKKYILKDIENGIFTQNDYEKNSYLKGFLKTYMKDLGLLEKCDIENLFVNNSIDLKSSGVSLDSNKTSSSKFGSLIILVSLIFIGLLFLFPMYISELIYGKKITINIPVILTIGYVVLFAGIGAYTFWNAAIKLIGPSRSGIFLHLMPIFSSLMAVFILNEKFSFHHIVGALLIIFGILLSSSKKIIKQF